MKRHMAWWILLVSTSSAMADINGLNAYRQGHFKQAADALRGASKLDATGAYYLGRLYLQGFGTLKNTDKAIEYLSQAAEGGDLKAQQFMGRYTLSVKKDLPKALYWFSKAANSGDVNAQMYCAAAYIYGVGTSVNEDKARRYYIDAARAGNPIAQFTLAEHFLNSRQSGNRTLGLLWLQKAAAQGFPEAQWLLSHNTAGDVNSKSALKSTLMPIAWKVAPLSAEAKAAIFLSHGNARTLQEAGYSLTGILTEWHNPLMQQEGVYNQTPELIQVTKNTIFSPEFKMIDVKNIPLSVYFNTWMKWQHANAEVKPFVFSSYPLSKTLSKFQDKSWFAKSSTEMIEHLKSRATLGDAKAQFMLGKIYDLGLGVNRDLNSAIIYYQQAAAQQYVKAIYTLGVIYIKGDGVEADYTKGLTLLVDAAFMGNVYAQYALANIYSHGYRDAANKVVIQPSPIQAEGMYYLAAANGSGLAQFQLANQLAQAVPTDLSEKAQHQRTQLIQHLYKDALSHKVAEAVLPVAFFKAMSKKEDNQKQAFEVANKEAEDNHAAGALLLALMYDRGIGVSQNTKKALYWYEKAGNNPVSNFILGTYYHQGTVVSINQEKSQDLLRQAAEASFDYAALNLAIMQARANKPFLDELNQAVALGNSTAGLLLADYYLTHPLDTARLQQAKMIYERLAALGEKDAQLKLGFIYENGLGVPVNPQLAQDWYQRSAVQHQPMSAYLLGRLYQYGALDGKPDYVEAKKWYVAAGQYTPAIIATGFIADTVDDDYVQAIRSYEIGAKDDNPTAAFNLGLIYVAGKGVPVDFEKARHYFELAAKKGNSDAMFALAYLNFNGQGGSIDAQAAVNWYQKAAALGNPDAAYQLGLLFETGIGVAFNVSEARHYYENAASLGQTKALMALARMYQYGIGGKVDLSAAAKLYQQLAEQKNAFAQYQLATIYYEGLAGKPMRDEALKLLLQAKMNGSWCANRALQRLEATRQPSVSFIETLGVPSEVVSQKPAELLYFDALTQWDGGADHDTAKLFDTLQSIYPNYMPAKRLYQQVNQFFHWASKDGLDSRA